MSGDPKSAPVPALLGGLRRLNGLLELILAWIAGLTLGALLTVVVIDVIFRQIINQPVLWPSEFAVLLFIWSVLAGASVSARRRAHFIVDLFPAGRWPMFDLALAVTVALLSLVFSLVTLYYGYKMSLLGISRFTPMIGYPMVYHFTAFPVAGACITLFVLEHLVEALSGHYRPAGPADGVEGGAV